MQWAERIVLENKINVLDGLDEHLFMKREREREGERGREKKRERKAEYKKEIKAQFS